MTSAADSGPGSLRSAIESLNASGEGEIDLQSVPEAAVHLESSLPEIVRNLRLIGPTSGELRIDGQGRWPIFSFAAGTTSEVSRLVLTNALATGYRHGAAVSNAGALVTRECLVVGNRNQYGWGGGIYNQGDLSLFDCTFRTNTAIGEPGGDANLLSVDGSPAPSTGAAGGGAGFGGALFQEAGRLSASNCVFVGNRAEGGTGGRWVSAQAGTSRGGGLREACWILRPSVVGPADSAAAAPAIGHSEAAPRARVDSEEARAVRSSEVPW